VFTSDFSVNEFLLVRKAGFEPIGLCVGTLRLSRRRSVRQLEQEPRARRAVEAMCHARELAMSRMRAEATAMQADGIVGSS